MGAESMEIYQIHWPFGALSSRYWDGLADCVDQGLVKVRKGGGAGEHRGSGLRASRGGRLSGKVRRRHNSSLQIRV